MKKMLSAVSFLGLSTVLAGCDTSVAQAVDVTTEIETIEKTVIEKLNAVTKQEATLQDEFEATLADDEDLSSLQDGSATVYENIKTRQTDVDSLQEAAENLQVQLDELETIESDQLPTEELTAVTDHLTTLSGTLSQFIDQYNTSLEQQDTYFQSLVAEDATFQTLETGIEKINETHTTSNELLIQLDDNLTQLQTARTEASTALESLEK